MLDPKEKIFHGTLCARLSQQYDDGISALSPLSTHSAFLEQIFPHVTCIRQEDLDEGPREAWFTAYYDLPPPWWHTEPINYGHCFSAYLCWDHDRQEKYGLLGDYRLRAKYLVVVVDVSNDSLCLASQTASLFLDSPHQTG